MPEASADTPQPLDAGALCVGCGMCCDGTLYNRARVEPGEEDRIAAHGLELIPDGERTFFRLPCRFQDCGRCTIYESRFTVCRTFTCALMRRCESGEVPLDEGLAKVETALRLRAKVAAATPEAAQFRHRRELRAKLADGIADGSKEDRVAAGRRLIDIVALDAFLDRWFRNKKLFDDQDTDAANS